jgi:hypothetical protein
LLVPRGREGERRREALGKQGERRRKPWTASGDRRGPRLIRGG